MANVCRKHGFDLREIDTPRDTYLRGGVLADVDIGER